MNGRIVSPPFWSLIFEIAGHATPEGFPRRQRSFHPGSTNLPSAIVIRQTRLLVPVTINAGRPLSSTSSTAAAVASLAAASAKTAWL